MAQSTKSALAASLKKLLAHKTLDKITVRDITDECGVNRQTFYYHFQDVYALIEYIFEEDMALALNDLDSYATRKDAVLALLQKMKENRTLVLHADRSVESRLLRRYLTTQLRPVIARIAETETEGLNPSPENLSFLIEAFTYMLAGLAMEWLDDNMDTALDKDLDKVMLLIDGSMQTALQKLESGS